eukprot:Platyproteum_vivax@DN6780_c0_g1_i2.p1
MDSLYGYSNPKKSPSPAPSSTQKPSLYTPGDVSGNYRTKTPEVAPSAWAANRAKMFVPHAVMRQTQPPPRPPPIVPQARLNTPDDAKLVTMPQSSSPSNSSRTSPAPVPSHTQQDNKIIYSLKSAVMEYDPVRPNDYEALVRERVRKKMLVEVEKRKMEEAAKLRQEREEQNQVAMAGAKINLRLSGEEAFKRRGQMNQGAAGKVDEDDKDGGIVGQRRNVAAKLMEKMGWKEGQGLGRQKQGITTPLVAKKTDRNAGVIVQGQQTPLGEANQKVAKIGTQLDRAPTKVLLLMNLVGPGEVDDELEREAVEEASKYGNLLDIKIYEVKEPNTNPDEAVRVFLKYERVEESTKAFVDLNGRFFGGRTVCAKFYDETQFDKSQLAPEPSN